MLRDIADDCEKVNEMSLYDRDVHDLQKKLREAVGKAQEGAPHIVPVLRGMDLVALTDFLGAYTTTTNPVVRTSLLCKLLFCPEIQKLDKRMNDLNEVIIASQKATELAYEAEFGTVRGKVGSLVENVRDIINEKNKTHTRTGVVKKNPFASQEELAEMTKNIGKIDITG